MAMLARYIARELGHPSGPISRLFLGPLWNRRNAPLNEAALQLICLVANDRVLDVGFGGGYLLERILQSVSEGRVSGVDISRAMVDRASRRFRPCIREGRMDLWQGSVEEMPYPARHFSKVCSVNSVFYWRDPRAGLSEIARVLDADGLLALVFTCRESIERKGFARHGLRLYDAATMRQMLEGVSFRDVRAVRNFDRHRDFWCITARR